MIGDVLLYVTSYLTLHQVYLIVHIYISTSNPHCGFYPPNYHAYPNNHPRNHALPIVCYYIVNPILYHRFCWLQ
jgi:hypothetical protein